MSGVVDSGRVNRDTRLPTALALWTTRSRRRRRRRAAVSHGKRGARCAEIAHGSNEDFGLRRRPTDPARCARLPDGTPHPRRTTPCRAASLHARQPAADVSPTSFGGARGGSALQDCLTSPFSIPPSRAGARRSLRLSAEVAQNRRSRPRRDRQQVPSLRFGQRESSTRRVEAVRARRLPLPRRAECALSHWTTTSSL